MATPDDPVQQWRVTFKLAPNDESVVKFIVQGDGGEMNMDDMLVSAMMKQLQGWSGMEENFLKQLRSAFVMRQEYTATLRSTRREMRDKGLVPRYRP